MPALLSERRPRARDTLVSRMRVRGTLVFASMGALLSGCGRLGYELVPNATRGLGVALPSPTARWIAGDVGVGGAGGGPSGGTSGETGGTGGTNSDARAPLPRDAGPADAAPDVGVVDASPPCTLQAQPIADWCTSPSELSSLPSINGRLACGLVLHAVTPQDWNGPGVPDVTVSYSIAWASNGLYFFVTVDDPSDVAADPGDPLWYGAIVWSCTSTSDGKYAAPPAYDNPGTRQFVVAAPDPRSLSLLAALTTSAWAFSAARGPRRRSGVSGDPAVTSSKRSSRRRTWGFRAGRSPKGRPLASTSGSTCQNPLLPTRARAAIIGSGSSSCIVDPSPTGQPYRNVAAFCVIPTLAPR